MTSAIRTTDTALCPKCGGQTYDNRAENDARLAKGEKLRPDFKCRDRACDGAIWRPKNAAAPRTQPAPVKQAFSAGPRIPQMDEGPAAMPSNLDYLFALYGVCMSEAIQQAQKLQEADYGATSEVVASMTHTLFIQAAKL